MRTSLICGPAIVLSLLTSVTSAASIDSPTQLRTHSLFAEVEFATFQDSSIKSFMQASLTSESISAALWHPTSFTGLLAKTSGTNYENLDRIQISFANNMSSAVLAKSSVKFSLAQSAHISLGGLLPGGPYFQGNHDINVWGNRSSELLGSLNELNQTIALDSGKQYELRLGLTGDTASFGAWGSWNFDVVYQQSVPVPGPLGLSALLGVGLLRRRRR